VLGQFRAGLFQFFTLKAKWSEWKCDEFRFGPVNRFDSWIAHFYRSATSSDVSFHDQFAFQQLQLLSNCFSPSPISLIPIHMPVYTLTTCQRLLIMFDTSSKIPYSQTWWHIQLEQVVLKRPLTLYQFMWWGVWILYYFIQNHPWLCCWTCVLRLIFTLWHPATTGDKYADDTYLIISASNSQSSAAKINHVEEWACGNNLKLREQNLLRLSLCYHNGRATI